MKKTQSKKGFTLAELLIVIAIIAILVAIAVPLFAGALDKANNSVEEANRRTIKAQATTDSTLNNEKPSNYYVDDKGNVTKAVPTTAGTKYRTYAVTYSANSSGEITDVSVAAGVESTVPTT